MEAQAYIEELQRRLLGNKAESLSPEQKHKLDQLRKDLLEQAQRPGPLSPQVLEEEERRPPERPSRPHRHPLPASLETETVTLELSPFLRAEFDVGSAPEPWLPFDAGAVPLVALTTNPGARMPHQHRDAIRSGRSVIDRASSCLMAAEALARFYATVLSGPARWRIRSLARLAALAGYEGVLQVESCPFHSARLPNKRALVRANKGDGVLGTYVGHLQHFLAGRPVVAVSAVSSRTPLPTRDKYHRNFDFDGLVQVRRPSSELHEGAGISLVHVYRGCRTDFSIWT